MASKFIAQRLFSPFASMKSTEAGYALFVEFFQLHVACLEKHGLSRGEITEAIALRLCQILEGRHASP